MRIKLVTLSSRVCINRSFSAELKIQIILLIETLFSLGLSLVCFKNYKFAERFLLDYPGKIELKLV